MVKRFAAVALSIMLLLCGIANAEPLKMLDTGDEVLALKKALMAAGYLEATEETTNVFDKATKNAIEELQKDFELEETGVATPEIQVICTLLGKLTMPASDQKQEQEKEPGKTDTDIVIMPDVAQMTPENASSALRDYGLYTVYEEQYSEEVKEGYVVCANFPAETTVRKGTKITLYVSKGPKRIDSKDSNIRWWNVKGSNGDDYEFESPYIYDGTLIIKLEATLNSEYSLRWRNFGKACITDRFDKTVPIQVIYKDEQIKKGKTQNITLMIPVNDLDVKKPTTLSVELQLYRGKQTPTQIRLDFTMTW